MNPKLAHYLTPIVALFFATALGVTAATTIGTNIATEGALSAASADITGPVTITDQIDSGATQFDISLDDDGDYSANFDLDVTYGSAATADLTVTREDVTQSLIFSPFSSSMYADYDGVISSISFWSDIGALLGSTENVQLDGGADDVYEVVVRDGEVELNGCIFYGSSGDPPLACDAGKECDWFYSTTIGTKGPCYCDGTNWVRGTDMTTVCTTPE